MEKTALISVSDKTGVVEFAKELCALDYIILSTGGTAQILRSNGIPVTLVSDYTGHPEMLEGRVKTLHPKIHAGILAKDTPEHSVVMESNGYDYIDLIAVNLYPFEKTIAWSDCTVEEAVEQIDIGGPTMLRAAAKNYDRVTVICNPMDYKPVVEFLKTFGKTDVPFRKFLAYKVFKHTSGYDTAISNYLVNNLSTVER